MFDGPLSRLTPNDGFELVEQRLVPVGEVRERRAQDGRHIVAGERASGSSIGYRSSSYFSRSIVVCAVIQHPEVR